MRQSHRLSIIEAITNVVVGYAFAVITQIIMFPFFELEINLSDNLAIGAVFVGISLIRSYALRRLFERLR